MPLSYNRTESSGTQNKAFSQLITTKPLQNTSESATGGVLKNLANFTVAGLKIAII